MFPQAWREFVDSAGGMLAHSLQNIDQVNVWIYLVQPASHDQTLDDADVFCAEFCPAEEPCLAPHGHHAVILPISGEKL